MTFKIYSAVKTAQIPWGVLQVCNDQDGEEVSDETDGGDDDDADALHPKLDLHQDGHDVFFRLVTNLLLLSLVGIVGRWRHKDLKRRTTLLI